MYEVQVTVRGPEGVRGYKKFRTTQKGSDELLERFKDDKPSGEWLNGIERDEDPESAAPARGGKKGKSQPAGE